MVTATADLDAGAEDMGPAVDDTTAFPPEYITDDEVAAAVAEGEKAKEQKDSPDTMARETPAADDPPEEAPEDAHGRRHRGGGSGAPLDLGPWAAAFAGHPFAQRMREFLERANNNNNNNDDDGSFTPPVDLFEQPDRWVLHLALPGAKKEDVGVNWDADRSVLSVSGVVHRPGDEDFISGMVSGERSVGLFSREVGLPPAGQDKGDSKEEVNAEGIVAKMEDGVLVVTVPKVERGWTEVRKVDIA
ncbi:hypothetical protein KVR01_005047 [Diaporthe batatas]|uniref:uncharacterized protein n=1 Tax=Diaporthe batatas TaxID=748121 RepID=UPI001D04675F|nr:uncharacterized protein KVR01_005047 [Diaporthe batatas]KAG8164772.1 hypothetical protein KVR01_005047 [Diaporthe batatas]